jgi:dihydrofolate synthase/folylpolyglutamate synthase
MKFLEELASRRRFGMKPGLGTMLRVTERLGNPQGRVKAVHIAGTNGKGAVAAMLDACIKGGRYTSPHLVRLNERYFLHGQPVGEKKLEELAGRVAAVADADMTFFEALTAMAFLLYSEIPDEYTVLETGLGGRLDATNICRPELTVITRIGLDHCDWLGGDVKTVAAEKAGIIKPGVPVIVGKNADEALEVFAARAKEAGAPFHYAPDLADESEIPALLPLKGAFNRENAVTAIAALKTLGIPSARLVDTVWPGRFHKIGGYIIDGAHNPPAAKALAESLAGRKVDLIAGFCGDKDVKTVLDTLKPNIVKAYAVATCNQRSLGPEKTAEIMRAAGMEAVSCGSLSEALEATRGRDTLICGSLFLAGEALVALGAYPWEVGKFDAAELL